MSTRSAIIAKQADGTYRGIYCHHDGYVAGVGKTLLNHYQDPDKVSRLIALGDLSCLYERVEPLGPHSYSNGEEGTTIAYMRDRGERGCAARSGTLLEVEGCIGHNGHVYVFEDGAWTHNGHPLAEVVAADGD